MQKSIHRAHYELFTNALLSDNVSSNSVVLLHPTCGPTQQDDIYGKVRYLTYKELEEEISDERIKWAFYLIQCIWQGQEKLFNI